MSESDTITLQNNQLYSIMNIEKFWISHQYKSELKKSEYRISIKAKQEKSGYRTSIKAK